jgi:hypothetical protein
VLLGASADTTLFSGIPWMNAGDWPNSTFDYGILVGNSPESSFRAMRGLVMFDLSSIPSDATIINATLHLHLRGSNPADPSDMVITTYRITRPWAEMEATWNNTASACGKSYGSAAVGVWPLHFYFDVRELVERWVTGTSNYGLMLIGAESGPTDFRVFHTKESPSFLGRGTPPELIVDYIYGEQQRRVQLLPSRP